IHPTSTSPSSSFLFIDPRLLHQFLLILTAISNRVPPKIKIALDHFSLPIALFFLLPFFYFTDKMSTSSSLQPTATNATTASAVLGASGAGPAQQSPANPQQPASSSQGASDDSGKQWSGNPINEPRTSTRDVIMSDGDDSVDAVGKRLGPSQKPTIPSSTSVSLPAMTKPVVANPRKREARADPDVGDLVRDVSMAKRKGQGANYATSSTTVEPSSDGTLPTSCQSDIQSRPSANSQLSAGEILQELKQLVCTGKEYRDKGLVGDLNAAIEKLAEAASRLAQLQFIVDHRDDLANLKRNLKAAVIQLSEWQNELKKKIQPGAPMKPATQAAKKVHALIAELAQLLDKPFWKAEQEDILKTLQEFELFEECDQLAKMPALDQRLQGLKQLILARVEELKQREMVEKRPGDARRQMKQEDFIRRNSDKLEAKKKQNAEKKAEIEAFVERMWKSLATFEQALDKSIPKDLKENFAHCDRRLKDFAKRTLMEQLASMTTVSSAFDALESRVRMQVEKRLRDAQLEQEKDQRIKDVYFEKLRGILALDPKMDYTFYPAEARDLNRVNESFLTSSPQQRIERWSEFSNMLDSLYMRVEKTRQALEERARRTGELQVQLKKEERLRRLQPRLASICEEKRRRHAKRRLTHMARRKLAQLDMETRIRSKCEEVARLEREIAALREQANQAAADRAGGPADVPAQSGHQQPPQEEKQEAERAQSQTEKAEATPTAPLCPTAPSPPAAPTAEIPATVPPEQTQSVPLNGFSGQPLGQSSTIPTVQGESVCVVPPQVSMVQDTVSPTITYQEGSVDVPLEPSFGSNQSWRGPHWYVPEWQPALSPRLGAGVSRPYAQEPRRGTLRSHEEKVTASPSPAPSVPEHRIMRFSTSRRLGPMKSPPRGTQKPTTGRFGSIVGAVGLGLVAAGMAAAWTVFGS
ncbi:hypothetical protein FN846DRAFT_995525, partial [Sphaerosporella brunnea]